MTRSSYPSPLQPAHYLPDGWDALWQSKKGNAPNEQVRLLILGDSIAAGQFSSDCVKKAWPGLIRDALTQTGRIPLAADYFSSFGHSAATANMNAAPWTGILNGHPILNSVNFHWHEIIYTSDAGATVDAHQTFTSPFACTAMDLFFLDYWAGTFQYQLDGGAWTSITMTGDNNGAHSTVKKQSLTGLSNAVHTLSVGKQSVNYGCLPIGVACYPTGGGNGLYLARFTYPGAKVTDYDPGQTSAQTPPERFLDFAGIVPQSYTGAGRTFGYPTQPHLAIISMGVNDCSAAIGTTNFLTTLRRAVQGLRAGVPNASIIFLINHNPDTVFSDSTASAYLGATWLNYVQQMYLLATQYGCAIVNIDAKWNTNPVAAGFMNNTNGIHPTDLGHQDIANTLLTVL